MDAPAPDAPSGGAAPARPVNVADYEALATAALGDGPLGYYAGGAEDERTLRENRAAWARRRLRPRVLVDVSAVTTATTVLGTPVASPVLVAPTALQRMAHPDGEPGMARAVAAAGSIMTLSTLATSTPAEVSAAAPGAPRWYQLYVTRDRGVSRALTEAAIDAGFTAIVVTVDAPVPGRRERDFRTAFRVPADLDMPAITAALGRSGGVSVEDFFSVIDPAVTWAELERFAADCPLPVLVKGIQTGEDAALACEHGAAGVVVSNHGGRQLDGVAATAEILPEVVEQVAGRLEVLVDGGIRRGSDVLVALALGARAVLVGRPMLWGLAAGGEAGARDVLALLNDEVLRGLALLGCASPAQVTRAHVS
jgi:isopentenyl diphosphate isomerase/L-lactate dehydrogenase-like FMN-dependent dehydrogenase